MAERKGGVTTTIDVATLPKKPKKTRRDFTDAQKAKMVARIRADMARGIGKIQAARKAGIVPSMAYRWLKEVPNGKAPTHQVSGDAVMITLLIQGQPLTVSLEDAIKIQQGLGQLLRFQR